MGYVAKNVNVNTYLKFYGLAQELIVTSTAGNVAMNSVTPPALGRTVNHAYAGICIYNIYNTNVAANKTNINQYIQVDQAAAGYTNALLIPNNSFYTDASGTLGGCGDIIGSIDIKAKVTQGTATTFQWENADADQNNLVLIAAPVLVLVVS